ncbi:DUF362 domain-containing protein [candidate division KSB1 bacterium]|nr:DUF362 domain-containing protein [candidate division KSB1 bacterium]
MSSFQNRLQKNDHKSIVSIVRCRDYEQGQVDDAIDQSIKNIGGFDQLIKQGSHVHIKPNLLTAKSPEKAATTHPSVVKSLVKRVLELGGLVTIGDSPAGISRPIEEYWQATGMEQIAKETGAKLVKLEKQGVVERTVDGKSYFIASVIAEADVVINVCKLKTHNLTLFTGAIKNMFGAIPGFKKSEYHKQAPKVEEFSEIIVDIFSAVRPQINIMDAIEIMEGNGPSAGRPRHLGVILASKDAVALDAIASNIVGFEAGEILTTEKAYQRGLGEKDIDKIAILGESLEALGDLQIALPTNRFQYYIPASVVKVLGKLVWVRPKPDANRCKRCGACIAICPTRAMNPKDGFPVIDYNKCISCFCCDEVCPHNAIDQDMSWLTKLFR